MRHLGFAGILVALCSIVAVAQLSHRDRSIDLIRTIVRPFAELPRVTYDDLEPLLEGDIVNLGSIMTSREFSATGLAKLSPGEIEALNRWISEFAFDLLRPGRGCSPAIESKIDGEFEGWSGDTIFKLTNGQMWQQASYDYEYSYKYRPDVIIFPSSGRCKMLVEGMDDAIEVKQLR